VACAWVAAGVVVVAAAEEPCDPEAAGAGWPAGASCPAANAWARAAAAVGEDAGWPVVEAGVALAPACAVLEEDGSFCAWVASGLAVLSLAGVDCPLAGELVPVEGSDSPAANMSGVTGAGGAAGVPFDPTAGVMAEFGSADAVSAGVAAAGAATGTSTATAAAAAASAAADGSVPFVWSVFDEDFEELVPSPESVFESVEPDAVWLWSSA